MFLTGPLLQVPLLDRGSLGSSIGVTGQASVSLIGSSSWGRMFVDAEAEIAYFVEIEPWVLADRS